MEGSCLMHLKKLLLPVLLVTSSAATADQTLIELQEAASEIRNQLTIANQLAWEIDFHAHNGIGVDQGTVEAGLITQSQLDRYNNAIDGVINATYRDASQVFMEEHNVAINNMHNAIDNLVEASVVLTTVVEVADMAEATTTTEEQQQLQQVLSTNDMKVDQETVDSFNTSLVEVETFANQAAGFLSAALDTSVTDAVDSYATSNNVAVSSYTSVQYDFLSNSLMFDYGTNVPSLYITDVMGNVKTAEEIYDSIGYYGG